jgi:hypothetical protein
MRDSEVGYLAAWPVVTRDVLILDSEVRVVPPVENHPANGKVRRDEKAAPPDRTRQRVKVPIQEDDAWKPA